MWGNILRVNIETRALAESRFYNLMRHLKWDRKTTLGMLAILWMNSQEMLKIMASKEELLAWIETPTIEEANMVFDALVKCQYLTENGRGKMAGLFTIHGNAKHVASAKLRRYASSVAGKASVKARNIKDFERNVDEPLTIVEPNAVQCSSIQSNAVQKETTNTLPAPSAKVPAPVVKKVEAKTTPLWELYRTCYKNRYQGSEPANRDASTNSLLSKLISAYGSEKAGELVVHYFKMRDPFYQKNYFSVKVLYNQHHQIHGSMTTKTKPLAAIQFQTEIKQQEIKMNFSQEELRELRNNGVNLSLKNLNKL